MNRKLWSDSDIDNFLQKTIGKEALPTTPEDMIKMARAAINVIVASYEERDAHKREAAHIALESIDKILVSSTSQIDPKLRATGLHLALESLRISFLIVRDF